jgi:C-terminal processing protease CtpA/Prc
MKLFLFSLIVLLCSACATNKYKNFNATKKYSPEALQQDYTLLRNILETDHPSIYWYTNKQKMDDIFDVNYQKLKDSLSEWKYKKIISEVVSNIQCGHTSVRSSKGFEKWIAKAKLPYFPFGIKAYNDTMAVAYNLYRKDTLLKRGTIINSINGYTSKQIIDSIFKSISTDGVSNNFKYMRLSNNFPYFYSQSFDTAKLFLIQYTDSTGIEKTLQISSYKVLQKDTTKKIVAPITPINPIAKPTKRDLKIIKRLAIRNLKLDTATSTAILTLNSFSGGRQKSFFKRTFKKLKKEGYKNLILDVRNNGGGDVGNYTALSKYFTHKPTKLADSVFANNKFSTYRKYIKTRLSIGLRMITMTKKRSDGKYHFGYFERHYDKTRKHNHFDGKIVVITGGVSFSATTLLINAIKDQPNVSLVGEETGGGAYGNSAINIPNIVLPNTKLRIRLPIYRLVMDKNRIKNGRGFIPNYYVGPTLESIIKNKDIKMEKAKEIIKLSVTN